MQNNKTVFGFIVMVIGLSLLFSSCSNEKSETNKNQTSQQPGNQSGQQFKKQTKFNKTLPKELEAYRPQLESSKMDYIRIKAVKVQNTKPWESKFLGRPYMPPGFVYPKDPEDSPLCLLAQINFKEVPQLEGYPTSGILQFYISGTLTPGINSHVYGMKIYKEKNRSPEKYFKHLREQGYFRVIYHADVIEDESKLEKSVPLIPRDGLPLYEEARLSFSKDSGYIVVGDYRFERFFKSNIYDFANRFGQKEKEVMDGLIGFTDDRALAKIGGYAHFIQDDPRLLEPEEDWLVLLWMGSSTTKDGPDIIWGDSGAGGFFIRKEDLLKRNFSNVMYYWDSH